MEHQGRDHTSHAILSKVRTQALNAASRAVGEVRRSLGTRAAAEALPGIFATAGIAIPVTKPEQTELDLQSPEEPPATG